jgi:threonine/homoserine/homoserine lactone efflux protein
MFDSYFWAFVGLAALLTITPGADTVVTLHNAVAGGTRAGLWTTAGVCSGVVFQPLLAALGVAALFVRSAVAFDVIKLAGAAYLIFLGMQSLRSAWREWRRRPGDSALAGDTAVSLPVVPGWRRYREGLLTNALNPKIAVFYFAVLPQFIRPGDPALSKSLLMAACHYGMGALWLSTLSLLAGRARTVLLRPRVRAGMDTVTGIAMIGFGVRLAVTRAR